MIYIYDGEHYTEHELINHAETMAHYDAQDSGEHFGIKDIDDAIAFLGEDEVDVVDDGHMAYGGGVEEGNLDMVKNQVIQVEHHAKELMETLKSNPQVDAWVVAKMDRATSNLSDITHYLEGEQNSFADGGYMAKGGQHKVNKKYAYFAVNKKTNKIIDGWEIVDDVESLKYYAKMDLEDNDLNPKDYNLLSAKTLKARGIDPYSWDSWAKTGEYAKGGHTQGYDDREDERLAMEHGKISDKDFGGSHEQREHSRRDDARFEERMRMGGVTFEDKVSSISKSLLKRKKVSPSVQKDYGKTYSKSEAVDSAKRIAGAMRKKEMAKKKR
jgi:hypothetical protein